MGNGCQKDSIIPSSCLKMLGIRRRWTIGRGATEKKTKRRAIVTGSIFKLPNGKSRNIKHYRSGKPCRECVHSEKKSDAERLLKLREGTIAAGNFAGLKPEKTNFEELSADLVSDYKVNENKSIWRVEIYVAQFKQYFEGYRANNITTQAIKGYTITR
ncbi:MAG: hypothetical protein WCQ90_01695 [Deltaproteobacteria bacterium]